MSDNITQNKMIEVQVEMLQDFNELLDALSREGACGCAQSEFLSAVAGRYANGLRGCYTEFTGQTINEVQQFAREYANFMIEVCDMYESVIGVACDE